MPARVRCGPREQRERERGDELEHFYHKSKRLGSAHSIFSKTPGGAAAISLAKPPSPKSSSLQTPRWRGMDSNCQFRFEKTPSKTATGFVSFRSEGDES